MLTLVTNIIKNFEDPNFRKKINFAFSNLTLLFEFLSDPVTKNGVNIEG